MEQKYLEKLDDVSKVPVLDGWDDDSRSEALTRAGTEKEDLWIVIPSIAETDILLGGSGEVGR
jgi:hypothetical protein